MPIPVVSGMRLTPTVLKQLTFTDVQAGVEVVTFASATFHSRTVTFPRAFASAPNIVIPVIDSGSAETDRWIARVFSVTATGFGLSLVEATSTARAWTVGRAVDWIAVLL